jgi:hypothetical protein
MTELMAWDGPWSPDLINAMLPVAMEVEIRREQAFNRAALAAIASVFSKSEVGREYGQSLEKALEAVRADQLASRGIAPSTQSSRHSSAAQKLLDVIGKAKLKQR